MKVDFNCFRPVVCQIINNNTLSIVTLEQHRQQRLPLRNTQLLLQQVHETCELAQHTTDALARQQDTLRQAHMELAEARDAVRHTDAPLQRMDSFWDWALSKLTATMPVMSSSRASQRQAQRFETQLETQLREATREIQALEPDQAAPNLTLREDTPLLQRQYVQQQDAELEQTRQLLHTLKQQGLTLRAQLDVDEQRREAMTPVTDSAVAHMQRNMTVMDRLIERFSSLF